MTLDKSLMDRPSRPHRRRGYFLKPGIPMGRVTALITPCSTQPAPAC